MKSPQDIIINPIVSEKSMQMIQEDNTYCFKVDKNSNKVEIKKAIEDQFNVDVVDVNTMNMHGKIRSMGRNQGKRPDWKKAYVTLAAGDNIEVVEGM